MKAERKTWNTEYFILDIGTIDVMWGLNKEQIPWTFIYFI